MPWKRAKALPPPDNSLFDSCFRIQREAIAAAGRFIPLVVENVKGAQPYVGRAAWHFGSYYLWGDVPALMPIQFGHRKVNHHNGGAVPPGTGKSSWFFGNTQHELRTSKAKGFNVAAAKNLCDETGVKQGGGWFHDSKGTMRTNSSNSRARRAASAQIAKIPLPLSRHIAKIYLP